MKTCPTCNSKLVNNICESCRKKDKKRYYYTIIIVSIYLFMLYIFNAK